MATSTVENGPPPASAADIPCDLGGIGQSAMALEKAEIARAVQRIENIVKSYAAGVPLFCRSVLQDLDGQLALGRDFVLIRNFDNVEQKYSLTTPKRWSDQAYSYRIYYHSFQSLTILNPSRRGDDLLDGDRNPVSIVYAKDSGQPNSNLIEVRNAFKQHRRAWQESKTCMSLKHYFDTRPVSAYVNKIVCFGLGTLGRVGERSAVRSHTQHAAVETIAEALGEKGSSHIRCYAQDPAYNLVDKELLNSIGITALDDPKGFLEVDSETLVFSVSPNVPVKQIIADVQWPGAMLWNTVEPEEKERTEWKKIVSEGQVTWQTPYTTDPDSTRVRIMVQHYLQQQFEDFEGYFGDLTIYLRR